MRLSRAFALFLCILLGFGQASAVETPATPSAVLESWYKLTLQLARHTPTYSPPVASRSFAYIGVAAFEVLASGNGDMRSLAGQLNGLTPVPQRKAGVDYDEAVLLNAALARVLTSLFDNTGPSGQRALAALADKLAARTAEDREAGMVARSRAYGEAVADHILAWASTDGGAEIVNLGFPMEYTLAKGPENWVPTSTFALQQKPLLPGWGKNRTFAMPDGAACPLPPPPAYSENDTSEFYRQAEEVRATVAAITPEQRAIARFWSDDPMLSPTPPGHWISIALQIIARDKIEHRRSAEILARLGIGLADAFIGCWKTKYDVDLLRPVTYIRRVMDKSWEPILITPPFPEYPSGHSTQSGAAAAILTAEFGANFGFRDRTHERDGLESRDFSSFDEAAEEAGVSRLYGGIHFRAAIERGLDQGRCVARYVNKLETRKWVFGTRARF
jgi:hypothetical protein